MTYFICWISFDGYYCKQVSNNFDSGLVKISPDAFNQINDPIYWSIAKKQTYLLDYKTVRSPKLTICNVDEQRFMEQDGDMFVQQVYPSFLNRSSVSLIFQNASCYALRNDLCYGLSLVGSFIIWSLTNAVFTNLVSQTTPVVTISASKIWRLQQTMEAYSSSLLHEYTLDGFWPYQFVKLPQYM